MTDVLNFPEKTVESVDARANLRAFEDRILGENAVRIDGKIERGHGSKFQKLSAAAKAEYAALEQAVEAEQRLSLATNELSKAQAHHAQAAADVKKKTEQAKIVSA